MTSLWAKFGPFIVLVLFGGALVGALVGSEPLVPVALLLIIVCTLLGWRWPAAMVVAIGSSILLERAGILMTVVVPWTVAKVFVAGAIGLWGFQRILKRKRILRLTALSYSLAFVFLTMILSLAATVDLSTSIKRMFSTLLVFILVHLVASIADESDLEQIMYWMVPAALGYLIYGVGFGQMEEGRLIGTRANPNLWGTSLVFFCLPLLGFVVQKRGVLMRLVFALMFGLLLGNIALTASRSAALVFLMAVPLVFLPLRKEPKALLTFVVPSLVLVFGFLDFSVMMNRFSTISTGGEYSSVHRAEALVVGLQIFQENWLVGTGIDTFPMYFAAESHSGVRQAAHNMYLTTIVETGVFGGVASMVLLSVLFWLCISTLRRAWNTPREGLALGLVAMCIAWMFSGIFGGFYSETIVYFFIGILVALNLKVHAQTKTQNALESQGSVELAV